MSFVIRCKETGEMFSNLNDDDDVVFSETNPFVFARECDALFALQQLELHESCEVDGWVLE